MSDFKLFPGVNLANSLSRLTNKDYENSMHTLNMAGLPSVSDGVGSFDAHAFRDVARSNFASDADICSEVSRLTGSSFESTLIKMSMPKINY